MDVDFVRPINDASFAGQNVAYTGTVGNMTGWNPGPDGVIVWATTDCYIRIGEAAVATSADCPIPSFTPILFKVPPGTGATWRVSAIQISAGGTVYAKPVS